MNILYVNSLEANNKELARQLASCQAALADTEALEIGTGERLAKVEQQLAAALAACKLKDESLASAGILIDSLQQQLADSQKREVILRDALDYVIRDLKLRADLNEDDPGVIELGDGALQQAEKALAATEHHDRS